MNTNKIPVILDTDIGTDIDDMWALATLLKSSELDIKLITTATGDTEKRARIIAKFLEVAGREDIPIGIGPNIGETKNYLEPWVEDYDLSCYRGGLYEDGIQAIVDTILNCGHHTTIIGIAPFINISRAINRDVRIIRKSDIKAMIGSINRGYYGKWGRSSEYNATKCPKETHHVFNSGIRITISPLDTCAFIHLDGDRFQQIMQSPQPVNKTLINCTRLWYANQDFLKQPIDIKKETSILYDIQPIHTAISDEYLEFEEITVKVRYDGAIIKDPEGISIKASLIWKDLEGFKDHLVHVLIS